MNIVLIELILVVVVALGLGLWQLVDINRELRKSREEKQSRDHEPD